MMWLVHRSQVLWSSCMAKKPGVSRFKKVDYKQWIWIIGAALGQNSARLSADITPVWMIKPLNACLVLAPHGGHHCSTQVEVGLWVDPDNGSTWSLGGLCGSLGDEQVEHWYHLFTG